LTIDAMRCGAARTRGEIEGRDTDRTGPTKESAIDPSQDIFGCDTLLFL
jgi:hypothetical protein